MDPIKTITLTRVIFDGQPHLFDNGATANRRPYLAERAVCKVRVTRKSGQQESRTVIVTRWRGEQAQAKKSLR